MSILHDLKEYGFIGDAGYLIEWLDSRESDDFYMNYFIHYENKSFFELDPRIIMFDILVKANQELRKPLELSDFVRDPEPEEPKYIDIVEALSDCIEDEDLSMEEMIDLQFKKSMNWWNKAHDKWENEIPLFNGWEIINTHDAYIYLESNDRRSWCDFYINTKHEGIKFWIDDGFHIVFTKENFIRLCKSYNINLLK